MREKNEFGDDYSAEQTKIINHGFYYTNDGWKTVKTGLGKHITTTRKQVHIKKTTVLSHIRLSVTSFLEMSSEFIILQVL